MPLGGKRRKAVEREKKNTQEEGKRGVKGGGEVLSRR